jgi:hypothetical protein
MILRFMRNHLRHFFNQARHHPMTPIAAIRKSREKNRLNPGRRKWMILLLLIAIIAFAGAFLYPGWKAQAEAGAAYGARVGCSCLFVQGRALASCETDFEPGMEMVSLRSDPDSKSATASVPLLASRTAKFQGASGCILVSE